MKRITGVLALTIFAACKGNGDKGTTMLNIVSQNTGLAITAEHASEGSTLFINNKKLDKFNITGENIITDSWLHPGMNYLKLVSGKETIIDSVFFSYKIDFQLVKEYPHDTANFTEGLFLDKDVLYESTGLEGKSRIVRYQVGPQALTPINEVKNDEALFGEGIGISGNNLYQLTWRDHYVLVYDKTSLSPTGKFVYPKEGWGLTPNGDSLIASDGSASLNFISPAKFEIYKTLEVKGESGPLKNINELELVGNIVVANVWQTNTLAFIDKNTGIVLATADLTALTQSASQENPKIDVLNGIAYDPVGGTFLVTGKNWPKVYRIKLDAVWDKLLKQQ